MSKETKKVMGMKNVFVSVGIGTLIFLGACSSDADIEVGKEKVTDSDILNEVTEIAGEDLVVRGIVNNAVNTLYEVSDKEVDEVVEQVKGDLEGDQTLEGYLKNRGQTEEEFREEIKQDLLVKKGMLEMNGIGEEEKKKVYEENKHEVNALTVITGDEEASKKIEGKLKEFKTTEEAEKWLNDSGLDFYEVRDMTMNGVTVQEEFEGIVDAEKGKTVRIEKDGTYIVGNVKEKRELSYEELKNDIEDELNYEQGGSVAELAVYLEEEKGMTWGGSYEGMISNVKENLAERENEDNSLEGEKNPEEAIEGEPGNDVGKVEEEEEDAGNEEE